MIEKTTKSTKIILSTCKCFIIFEYGLTILNPSVSSVLVGQRGPFLFIHSQHRLPFSQGRGGCRRDSGSCWTMSRIFVYFSVNISHKFCFASTTTYTSLVAGFPSCFGSAFRFWFVRFSCLCFRLRRASPPSLSCSPCFRLATFRTRRHSLEEDMCGRNVKATFERIRRKKKKSGVYCLLL